VLATGGDDKRVNIWKARWAASAVGSSHEFPMFRTCFFLDLLFILFFTHFFWLHVLEKKFLHVLDLKMCRDERALEETTRVHGPDSTMVEHVNSVIIYMERSIYYLFL